MRRPEQWRSYPHNRYYDVSNWGKVRSWKSRTVGKKTDRPKILHPILTYRENCLVVTFVGQRGLRVSRIVWETFQGDVPSGFMVMPIDGNKLNMVLWNLQLVPIRTVMASGSTEHHANWKGDKNPKAKLSPEQIAEIIEDAKTADRRKGAGWSVRTAAKYGVNRSSISRLFRHAHV